VRPSLRLRGAPKRRSGATAAGAAKWITQASGDFTVRSDNSLPAAARDGRSPPLNFLCVVFNAFSFYHKELI
jgi:hypothetical protein